MLRNLYVIPILLLSAVAFFFRGLLENAFFGWLQGMVEGESPAVIHAVAGWILENWYFTQWVVPLAVMAAAWAGLLVAWTKLQPRLLLALIGRKQPTAITPASPESAHFDHAIVRVYNHHFQDLPQDAEGVWWATLEVSRKLGTPASAPHIVIDGCSLEFQIVDATTAAVQTVRGKVLVSVHGPYSERVVSRSGIGWACWSAVQTAVR